MFSACDWLIILVLICSSSSPWLPVKPVRAYILSRKIIGVDNPIFNHCSSRKKGHVRTSHLENGEFRLSCRLSDFQKQSIIFFKLKRMDRLLPLASADDGVKLNGSPQARTTNDVEEMRYKLNQSLQDEDYNTGLVQLLHDVARVFELAIKEQSSSLKITWFSTAWLGVDKNAWTKALAYQVGILI